MKLLRMALLAVATAALLGGCARPGEPAAVPTPKGFVLPAGVTLTAAGTSLAYGQAATVVHRLADKAPSAVTVAVTAVTRGAIEDFRFFSLDDAARQSTPVYVRATVRNRGPAALDGAPVPLYVHDSSDTVAPPNPLVGDFAPCRDGMLPASFPAGATATVCLVYLLPKGVGLESIDLRTADPAPAITWTP